MPEQHSPTPETQPSITWKHCALGTVAVSAFVGTEAGIFVGIGEQTDKAAMVDVGQYLGWGSLGLVIVGTGITAGVALRNKIVARRSRE